MTAVGSPAGRGSLPEEPPDDLVTYLLTYLPTYLLTYLQVQAFEALLVRRWEVDAVFLTYLETERLAADAAALVASGIAASRIAAEKSEALSQAPSPAPSPAELEAAELEAAFEAAFERLLDAQAAVMTVRGTVREDFVTSRGLSRI